jgi:uncharacterized membrane protein
MIWKKRIAFLKRRFCLYPEPELMPSTPIFWVATGLVTVAVILFCVYFIALLLVRHDAFMTNAEDFGITDQALWNTIHGHLLHQTICNIVFDTNCVSPAGTIRFAIHIDPLLIPISLLYFIWADPKVLLVLQTLVVASGAYPVFWLARLRLRSNLAAVAIAVLYLLYPAQQQALTFDFHAVTFTASFLLFMLYFMYTGRMVAVFIFAFLSLACKEEIGLVVAMFGVWALVFQWRWRSGFALFLIGVTWFGLAYAVIMPHFSPTGHPLLVSRYPQLEKPTAFIANSLLHPHGFLNQYVREPGHLAYLNVLFSPALYLPLLAPWILFMAFPSLAINLLSSNPQMYSGIFQYNAEIVPVLIFATVEALVIISWLIQVIVAWLHLYFCRCYGRYDGQAFYSWLPGRIVHIGLLVGLLGGTLVSTIYTDYSFYGQMPFSEGFSWPEMTDHLRLTQHFIEMIPPTASVSAQSKLVPHISEREHIYLFPYADDLADYVFLDVTSDPYPYNASQYMHEVQRLLLSGKYGIASAQDGYLLLKRGFPGPEVSPLSPMAPSNGDHPSQVLFNWPQSFCSNIYVQPKEVTHPLKVNFSTPGGGGMRLIGYDVSASHPFSRGKNTAKITTYWQITKPSATPLRLLLFAQVMQKEYLLTGDIPTLSWCPSSSWQLGKIVQIDSPQIGIQWTKVPDGLAYVSLALLPLVQSSSTIMDVHARLPLHVVSAPDGVIANPSANALQLMTLKISE